MVGMIGLREAATISFRPGSPASTLRPIATGMISSNSPCRIRAGALILSM